MDAEGSGSSLLYLLAWKMSLHVNFVKSQPAVSVTAGVLQIKNGPWVFVRACVRVCVGGWGGVGIIRDDLQFWQETGTQMKCSAPPTFFTFESPSSVSSPVLLPTLSSS